MGPSVLTHAYGRLANGAGIQGVRLHDLRHAHASLLLKARTHPKIVQERLGHSTIGITLDTYSHLIPSMQGGRCGRVRRCYGRSLNSKARSQMTTNIFLDESGYTGYDLVHEGQPAFVIATLNLEENMCLELKNQFFGDVNAKELKHSRLAKRPQQQLMVLHFLRYLNENKNELCS